MDRSDIQNICGNAEFLGEKISNEFLETHISWVLFTSQYALKIKKPIQLAFLDFSTSEKRLKNCLNEVELNSRITDIYLGVSSLQVKNGNWSFTPVSEAVGDINEVKDTTGEPVVVMTRIPEKLRMDHLVRSGEITHTQISELARVIAGFHRSAPVRDSSHLVAIWHNHWKEFYELLLQATERHIIKKEQLQQLKSQDISIALERLSPVLKERAQKGLIRDLHGDLHTANVFFNPHPVVFDCIEFNDEYRWIDQMDEIAMLHSDLMRLNKPQLANMLLKAYSRFNPGVMDQESSPLFIYYCAYRLSVRSKVLLIRVLESDLSNKTIQMAKKDLDFFLDKFSKYHEKWV
jgi:aminoglycoside phosphotransferase family enzyme